MKEYKILEANDLRQAEAIMNDMALAGWSVVSTTDWPDLLSVRLIITLEREVQ